MNITRPTVNQYAKLPNGRDLYDMLRNQEQPELESQLKQLLQCDEVTLHYYNPDCDNSNGRFLVKADKHYFIELLDNNWQLYASRSTENHNHTDKVFNYGIEANKRLGQFAVLIETFSTQITAVFTGQLQRLLPLNELSRDLRCIEWTLNHCKTYMDFLGVDQINTETLVSDLRKIKASEWGFHQTRGSAQTKTSTLEWVKKNLIPSIHEHLTPVNLKRVADSVKRVMPQTEETQDA